MIEGLDARLRAFLAKALTDPTAAADELEAAAAKLMEQARSLRWRPTRCPRRAGWATALKCGCTGPTATSQEVDTRRREGAG